MAGIAISIGTALIASGYSNIMNYIQVLFSVFNAPLFATFIIGMFWKRMTPWAGFWGMVRVRRALGTYLLYKGTSFGPIAELLGRGIASPRT